VQRVAIVGSTGSGKTTLARALAARLGLPHTELDGLYWGPGWAAPPPDAFRDTVAAVVAAPCWIVEGNYSRARDLVWSRADTVVWLDYPLPVVFGRLLRRTLRRVARREVLWGRNRESFRRAFLSADSILLWLLTSHHRHRRTYGRLLGSAAHRHLAVVHLRSPRQADAWLRRVTSEPAGDLGPADRRGALPVAGCR
jgi:hypothetical protein